MSQPQHRPANFGAYLVSVQERDIDLLLMEEFHVNVEFVSWFALQACIDSTSFLGAWHSVTDADGETDLLLLVDSHGQRTAILIENKVAAPEQDRQDERYHLRAARAQAAGKYDRFVTCICAPQIYIDALPNSSLYQHRIAYEAIGDWFRSCGDLRSAWRSQIMHEAIQQGRRGYKMIVNDAVSSFHLSFWEHLQRHHPLVIMRRPTPKGNKSNWIVLKGADFPADVQLHFKMDQRVVELGFGRTLVADILAVKEDWDESIVLVQKQGTAAISITVPFVDRLRPLAEQRGAVDAVCTAFNRLLPYGRLLERYPSQGS